MDVLTVATISSSAIAVAKKLIDTWGTKNHNLRLESRRSGLELPPGVELPPEILDRLVEALTKASPPAGVLKLSRQATGREAEPPPISKDIGAFALALSPGSVFMDARNRIDLVFRLNLGIAIALAVILLIGIAGGVYSSLFLWNSVWAFLFGGVSVADLIGVYAFKPLAAINAALVSTIRLDNLQLRLQEQLADCAQLADAPKRIECQGRVWDKIQDELAALSQVPATSATTNWKKNVASGS